MKMRSSYDNEEGGDMKKLFLHTVSWYRMSGIGSRQSCLLSSAIAIREIQIAVVACVLIIALGPIQFGVTDLLSGQNRPKATRVTRVIQGYESHSFKSYFDSWPAGSLSASGQEGRGKVAAFLKQQDVGVKGATKGADVSEEVPPLLAAGGKIAGLCEQTVKVLSIMEEEGIEPNLIMLNVLINAFGIAGRHKVALSIYHHIIKSGISPDVITYTTVMKAFMRAKQFSQIPELYQVMVSAGCSPDRKARELLNAAVMALEHRF